MGEVALGMRGTLAVEQQEQRVTGASRLPEGGAGPTGSGEDSADFR